MKTQNETVEIAGQSIVVRELTIEEIRQLLGLTAPKAVKPDALNVSRPLIAWEEIASRPRRVFAKCLHALWVRFVAPKESDAVPAALGAAWASALVERALSINGISLDYLQAMSTVTEPMLLDATPSEVAALVASCKRLNAFFFEKLVPEFAAIRWKALNELLPPLSGSDTSMPGNTPTASLKPQ